MKKHIVAPLVLLASISLLTSCMEKPVPVAPVVRPVETSVPVEIVTTPPSASVEVSPVASGTMMTPDTAPLAPVSPTLTATASTSQAPAMTTRTETVSYMSPAGKDEVEFSVTLKDGVITAASSKTLATNDASKYNQDNFAKALAGKVVGKKSADFDIDAIGGASLTTAAFEKFIKTL